MKQKGVWIVVLFVVICVWIQFPLRRSTPPTMSAAEPTTEATNFDGYFEIQGQQIHCKAYRPKGKANTTVLLLHGAAFSSENWKEIGTLKSLQEGGVFAFAIDLPGYGKSKDAKTTERAEFLKDVVEYLEGDFKVIVSPSMSGLFSIPYINDYGENIHGYVPVAPVSVDSLSPSKDVKKNLPVLAVAGEMDPKAVERLPTFKKTFKNYEELVIKKARHPAYLDDPELFNSKLLAFALSISSN